jgi:ATP-dependent Clp protease ATP-binding subunit ClpX
MAQKFENDAPACSFCGKKHGEVAKLIAGPDVNICDECINLCSDILVEDRVRRGVKESCPPASVPKPAQLQALLDEYAVLKLLRTKNFSPARYRQPNPRKCQRRRVGGSGACL